MKGIIDDLYLTQLEQDSINKAMAKLRKMMVRVLKWQRREALIVTKSLQLIESHVKELEQ